MVPVQKGVAPVAEGPVGERWVPEDRLEGPDSDPPHVVPGAARGVLRPDRLPDVEVAQLSVAGPHFEAADPFFV